MQIDWVSVSIGRAYWSDRISRRTKLVITKKRILFFREAWHLLVSKRPEQIPASYDKGTDTLIVMEKQMSG